MYHLAQHLPKKRHGSRWGSAFIWKLRQEIAQWGCHITTSDTWWCIWPFWQENQWQPGHGPSGKTRPCPVVYRYKGEGNSDGQTSCRHWDGLSSVSSEHSLKIKLPARLGLTLNQSKPNTHFQLLAFILETLHHPFEKMLQAWSSSICYIIPLNWL